MTARHALVASSALRAREDLAIAREQIASLTITVFILSVSYHITSHHMISETQHPYECHNGNCGPWVHE